jgi:hypothetical protein
VDAEGGRGLSVVGFGAAFARPAMGLTYGLSGCSVVERWRTAVARRSTLAKFGAAGLGNFGAPSGVGGVLGTSCLKAARPKTSSRIRGALSALGARIP